MKKLTPQQLATLHSHLIGNGSNDALMGELLDHLACEVEIYLWKGYNFELALEKISEEANVKAIQYLRQNYQHELAMTETQLQEATLDDIVFEFRNKAYGAYDLRQSYQNTLRTALFMGIGLFLMLIALSGGLIAKQWSFSSPLMLLWFLGSSCVAYGAWNWYLKNMQEKVQMG
ncbi:MAG: hypothetical protein EAZ32_09790 [Cytophagia bacterium]|nr:MAG: hypothetical protein EAZ46_06630 [Runella sp.]TAG20340.1 MAG: hypothetical protein EAZ38_10520 [Cytophagales bacterium]TAG39496.1 MAG: hypothetical protein EAZ32_09790 [Cytophagia bacterium]TAG48246.1 MAG: hypothetical protein EAZ29_13580 [Runella slithyformis]TAG71611.1 MAG: hypothetical protein EAZ26_04960 [Runella slithyformis]